MQSDNTLYFKKIIAIGLIISLCMSGIAFSMDYSYATDENKIPEE